MKVADHLSGDYWHDLTTHQPETAQFQLALLDAFEPLLLPLLKGTAWYTSVVKLNRLIRRDAAAGTVSLERTRRMEAISVVLEARVAQLDDTAEETLAAQPDHLLAAMAFTWIERVRGDILGKFAQWEIGVPAAMTALLTAQDVPEPVVAAYVELADRTDSVVLYHGLRCVRGRREAPAWLSNMVTGWARHSDLPPVSARAAIEYLLAADEEEPFTAAQGEVLATMVCDGLDGPDAAAVSRFTTT